MPDYPTPLSPAVYHILLALAGGPRHGYAITAAILEATEGELSMGPGTLYGSLKRMDGWGLVQPAEVPAGEAEADGRGATRRYYELTELGRRAAAEEARRLRRAVELAQAHDLLKGEV